MLAEAENASPDVWKNIFDSEYPDGESYRAGRQMLDGTGETTPELAAWVRETVAKFDQQGLVVNSFAYVRVRGQNVQWPHRDLRRSRMSENEKVYSTFLAVNVDTPPPYSGYFVLNSTTGLPDPWVEVPLLKTRGDMTVIPSTCIHAGGANPPVEGGPRWRYVAFAGLGTHRQNYDATCPVMTPPPGATGSGG